MADEHMPHKLCLNERRQLTMTGVTEVVSFDDTAVVLQTSLGTLIVQGKELQLKTLSLEGGQVEVDGSVSALAYEERRQPAGSAVCSDDRPRAGCTPIRVLLPAGGSAGGVLRILTSPASTVYSCRGRAVSDGLRLGLADYELSCGQGRPAAWVFRWSAGGGDRLGSGVRQPDRTHFFRILEIRQGNPGLCAAARKKIFRICKNFICICEKMGYNKVESSSGKTAKTKR